MAKRFITPFAEVGDRAAVSDIPTGTDVNYQTGYPAEYEADPIIDPAAKFVERDKNNQIYNDITANIKEWQEHTYPEFITSVNNGGVPFSYRKNSIVSYSGVDYASSVDGNEDVPPSSKWEIFSTSLINTKNNVAPNQNIVFDMHNVPLKNQGVMLGETFGQNSWAIDSSGVIGDLTISSTGNSAVAGQLIGYKGIDNEYYSARVKTAGTTLTLHDALEVDVDTNGIVFQFYINEFHPTILGFYAIADYFLRQETFETITSNIESLIYNKLSGPETISTLSTDAYDNCGSSLYPAIRLETLSQFEGFFTNDFRVNGDADIELVINTNGANMQIRIAENDDIAQYIYDEIINCELPTRFVFPITKKMNSQVTVNIRQSDAGTADINFIMQKTLSRSIKINSLNGGVHVLNGDSWFALEGIYERLLVRLPNATIFNEGVGGSTSFNVSEAVETLVAPHKPDYVWLMCGTNDGVLGVSVSGFYRWMNKAIADTKALGSTPITFSPSVGDPLSASAWFAYNRAYRYTHDYREGEETEYTTELISFSNITVPGTTELFCGTAGRTKYSVDLVEAFGSGVNNIIFGYSPSISIPTEDRDVKAGNTTINKSGIDKSADDERYFTISCENTSGFLQTANGFARVRIKNSRN